MKLFTEGENTRLLLVSNSLQILVIDLGEQFKVTDYGNLADMLDEGSKVRSYDKIVGFVHFNPKSSHLFVSFTNSSLFVMVDLTTKKLVWNIPKAEKDRPLCAHSD